MQMNRLFEIIYLLLNKKSTTAKELAEYSDYFVSFEPVKARYDGSDLTEEHKALLKVFYSDLLTLEPWTDEAMEEFARKWSEEKNVKMKILAMPLRWVLTGVKVSPGIFEVARHLGKDEVQRRLAHYDLVE